MRTFLVFLALIAGGFAVIAFAAYPVWLGVAPVLGDVPFHRLANRLGMLALLVGFVFVARRLHLADRAGLGYGLPRAKFLRELGLALALGVAVMLPIAAGMLALGLRAPADAAALGPSAFVSAALEGLVRGLVVALVEETFLRGAMFTGIEREAGVRAAILLTAILYAAFHFVGRNRIPAGDLGWGSGLEHIAGTLRAFGNPLAILDAFLCLTAVGVLLGMVRAATGNIAACIGLHAGWVWVITLMRETTEVRPDPAFGWLVSDFDGFIGWALLLWMLPVGYAIVRLLGATRRSAG
jgi:uncharacterized protein